MGKLAVVFPGIGYTPDKPLLHYARQIAAEQGYEVRLISYTGFPQNILGNRDKMAESYRLALAQAENQLADTDLSCADDLLLIGKSIGTILAARFASKRPSAGRVRLILYTPMEDTFRYPLGDAVVFTGSEDPWVGGTDSRIPALCREQDVPCVVIPGGNHSLECGSAMRNILNLQEIMDATDQFVRNTAPGRCGRQENMEE